MKHILVTGGAGLLGRMVVKELSAAGFSVRGTSRRDGPGKDWAGAEWVQSDLATGAGLADAVRGMDVVVHAATGGNNHSREIDVEGTRRLLDAARDARVSHVVYISIVGIDKVPYAVGEAKLAAEELIQQSGVPWSILRATQFYELIDSVLIMMTKLPLVALVPGDLLLQPVAGEEVARRLCEIVRSGRSGRLPDIGGPKVYTSQELAQSWLKQRGMKRTIIPLPLPGKTAAAIREGGNTCSECERSKVSWEEWLGQRYDLQVHRF